MNNQTMKVTVFGGAGFLGSYVADELTSRGYQVTVFDKNKSPYLQSNQEFIEGDILDTDQVCRAVSGSEIVFNFAGLADLNQSMAEPERTLQLNVMGNLNILRACNEFNVKRFVYASTVYVFSDKGSFYGISKRCSEQIIEEFHAEKGLPFTILRYGSVYGERSDSQNRLHRIIKQALTEGKITYRGSGHEVREYIHGRDAARLSVDLLEKEDAENERFTLTGVEKFSYTELLALVKEMLQNNIDIDMKKEDYKGHYVYTPYSFVPKTSKKIVANPYIDFGQGLLETIASVRQQLDQSSAKTEQGAPSPDSIGKGDTISF